jgi:hypothetical protein
VLPAHGRDRAEDRKMNWRRGLFRLWLVASFLWIVGVIVFDSASTICAEVRLRFELGKLENFRSRDDFSWIQCEGPILLLLGPVLGSFFAGLIRAWIVRGFARANDRKAAAAALDRCP